jgi:hypothetical protein
MLIRAYTPVSVANEMEKESGRRKRLIGLKYTGGKPDGARRMGQILPKGPEL